MTLDRYVRQVSLLVRTIPEIAEEPAFALKGGTAINLFVRDLPRLSVDIDLVYLPHGERDESLAAMKEGLGRIAARLNKRSGLGAKPMPGAGLKLGVEDAAARVIIEVNPVMRGTVFPAELRAVSPKVEERFGFAEMPVLSPADLYAGKIVAALDRQNPRDLFDVHHLLEIDGISDDLFLAFLVYLVTHKRPPHELLAPNLQDIEELYEKSFVGMPIEPMPLQTLVEARLRLIAEIRQRVRGEDARAFLTSFFSLEPDWSRLGLDADIAGLPAVTWKMHNLEILRDRQRARFDRQRADLELVLGSL